MLRKLRKRFQPISAYYRMDEEISENNDLSGMYPAKLVELKTRLEKSYNDLVSDSHVWEKPNIRKKQ